MKRILTLAFSIVMTIAVMAADKATAYFSVQPSMTCQNCENKIKTNLRYEKGVKEIKTSLADQVVTVTYDPAKTNVNNLTAAFKKIGYTATTASAPKATKTCTKANGSCCKNTESKKCCGKGECAKTKKTCADKKDCGAKKSCNGKACSKSK